MSMQVPKNGFTHGGKFHADDVFSTALLRILRECDSRPKPRETMGKHRDI